MPFAAYLRVYQLRKRWIMLLICYLIKKNAIKKNLSKCSVKAINTYQKKLSSPKKNVTLPFTDAETVQILPNVTLTWETFQRLLVNKTDILTTFGFMHLTMTKDFRYENESGEVKTKTSRLAHSHVNSYQPILHALKKHRISKSLADEKDIAILRPDNDSWKVILNIDDYINKLSDLIGDT